MFEKIHNFLKENGQKQERIDKIKQEYEEQLDYLMYH